MTPNIKECSEDASTASNTEDNKTIIIDKDILCKIVECEQVFSMAPLYDEGHYVIIGKHAIVVCYRHGERWLRTLKILPREINDIEHIPEVIKELSKAGKTLRLPWITNIISIGRHKISADEDIFYNLLVTTALAIEEIPTERLVDYLPKLVIHMEVFHGAFIEKYYDEDRNQIVLK